MFSITKNVSKKFSLLSGDNNKIHFDKSFSKFFFFKAPIVHGVNLCILALNSYLSKKKNNLFIDQLKINFRNFCLNEEKFSVKNKKNLIIVKNYRNTKIDLEIIKSRNVNVKKLKTKLNSYSKKIVNFYKIKKLSIISNINLIKHLIFISYYVGSIRPGNSSLIHTIKTKVVSFNLKTKSVNFKKILNNIYHIKLSIYGYESEIVASKLKKFNFSTNLILSNKILKKIKNKKFLFFGLNSDLAIPLVSYLKKKSIKYENFSLNKKKIFTQKNMRTLLNKFNPDYIFYLSSPPIISDNFNSNFLFKSYKKIYYDHFLQLLNCVNLNKSNLLIFYPSSFFLDDLKKYSNFNSYIRAKQLAEKLCRNHVYKKFIKIYRLPKFKTRSNYNFLGFYEGENLNTFKKYLIKFFN